MVSSTDILEVVGGGSIERKKVVNLDLINFSRVGGGAHEAHKFLLVRFFAPGPDRIYFVQWLIYAAQTLYITQTDFSGNLVNTTANT